MSAQPAKTADSLVHQLATSMARTAVRQFSFPTALRTIVEVSLFCGVFIVAGIISLGTSIQSMLAPMVPFVLVMMFSMVASGV